MTNEQENPRDSNVREINFRQKDWNGSNNSIFAENDTEIAIQEIKGQWSLTYVLIWVVIATLSLLPWVALGWVLKTIFG